MKIGPGRIAPIGAALIGALLYLSQRSQSQEPSPQAPTALTGSVNGQVFNGATKLPVRFAEVRLVPIRPDAEKHGIEGAPANSNPPVAHLVSVRGVTGFDGSFRIEGVPVGDYYAGALAQGLLMAGVAPSPHASESELRRAVDSLPKLHIDAGRDATVNLALSCGATIAGRVQYADGSPAVGASVSWERAEDNLALQTVRLARPTPPQQVLQSFSYYTEHEHRGFTDEDGRYRFFGLPAGNYIVETLLASQLGKAAQLIMSDGSDGGRNERQSPYPELTVVYAPSAFRRRDARIFTVQGCHQAANADIKIDPSGLRAVQGRVLAEGDRHVPSRVMVRIEEDGGNDIGKFVTVAADGSFTIDHLLPGAYTLQAFGADDEPRAADPNGTAQIARHFQLAKRAFVIAHHDVVLDDLILIALKPGETQQYPQ